MTVLRFTIYIVQHNSEREREGGEGGDRRADSEIDIQTDRHTDRRAERDREGLREGGGGEVGERGRGVGGTDIERGRHLN